MQTGAVERWKSCRVFRSYPGGAKVLLFTVQSPCRAVDERFEHESEEANAVAQSFESFAGWMSQCSRGQSWLRCEFDDGACVVVRLRK